MGEVLTVYGKEIPITLHKVGKYQYWRASIYSGKKRPDEYQGSTKEILQKKLEASLPCSRPEVNSSASGINLIDWIYKWYDVRKFTFSPSTRLSYHKAINSMKKFYDCFSIGSITHEDAQKLIEEEFKSGLGWQTVKKNNHIAKEAMELALLHGYIRYNPFDGLHFPTRSHTERLPLSHWEFQEFLKAIELSPRCNALAVMVFAGLRIGECRGLCWEDVNFQEKCLTIRRQRQTGLDENGRRYEFLQNKTKNGRDQRIYPPEEVFRFLENERVRQNYYRKLCGDSWENNAGYVFTTPKGKYLEERAVQKALDVIGRQINRPDLTAHYLRHTAGTRMYELSNDLRATQDFLRHSHIQTTLCYVHTSKERKENAMRKYDEYIKGKRSGESIELFEL